MASSNYNWLAAAVRGILGGKDAAKLDDLNNFGELVRRVHTTVFNKTQDPETRVPFGGQYYYMPALLAKYLVSLADKQAWTIINEPFVPLADKGTKITSGLQTMFGAMLCEKGLGRGAKAPIVEKIDWKHFRGAFGFTGTIGVGKTSFLQNLARALAKDGAPPEPIFFGPRSSAMAFSDRYNLVRVVHGPQWDYLIVGDFDQYISSFLSPPWENFPYHAFVFYMHVFITLAEWAAKTDRPYYIIWDRCLMLDGITFMDLGNFNRSYAITHFRSCFGDIMDLVCKFHPSVNFLLHLDNFNKNDKDLVYGRIQERGRTFERNLPYDFPAMFQSRLKETVSALGPYIPTTIVQTCLGKVPRVCTPDHAFIRFFLNVIEIWAKNGQVADLGTFVMDESVYLEKMAYTLPSLFAENNRLFDEAAKALNELV